MTPKSQLYIKKTTYQHFLRLADYHYIKFNPPMFKSIYGIYPRLPWLKNYPSPTAIITYSAPIIRMKARNKVLAGVLQFPQDQKKALQEINENIVYFSRLIVDPRYRKIGLGSWLLTETMKMQTVPYIETMTPFEETESMLKKAGFIPHHTPNPPYYQRVIAAMAKVGMDLRFTKFPAFAFSRIEHLKGPARTIIIYELDRFCKHFKVKLTKEHSIERMEYIFHKLSYPNIYWLYRSEKLMISSRNSQ